MKIIVVGATGNVGKTAVQALSGRHEIIRVGKTSGDVQMDIEDIVSIRTMYQQVGKVDAVVSAIGHVHFGLVHERYHTLTLLNQETTVLRESPRGAHTS